MRMATLLKLIFKTPAVYTHSFLIEIYQKNWWESSSVEDYGELAATVYYCHLSRCGFLTVGTQLPEPGEPLHFQGSLTTLLRGKQKLTNQKFALVKPQENILKGQSHCISTLIHITIAALQKPKPIQINLNNISLSIHLHVQCLAEEMVPWIILLWCPTERDARSLPQPKILNLVCWLTGISSWLVFLLVYFITIIESVDPLFLHK